ncbi:vacuolar protein-sorting-associated protein 33-like [Citrus sinensis]|uniref:Vacuolar protein-sorting-associated protein 33-like n=1 Tax=Citrus sinensis TaxID=2711 RepID=A0ACB8L527_CITSI|nr:vacuolar protein-sorting-associated protein 33-like [Citrus sinensis]
MAQIPNLDNAPLNLKSIREQSQRDLVNILKNIRGKKCLVIDPKLSGSLSLIVPTSTLKEYGIELRLLSAEPVQTDCAKVVYFVGPQFISMRFISSHVHDDASKGLQREYFLYFVPRRSVACEKILEEEKVHNLMTIGEYPLYMVPLDEDVLSFELDLAPKEWQVDGDASSLWHIAKAIHKLEFTFGLIPNVRAKGKASVRVAEILNRMQTEEPVSLSDMNIPEINTLVLIDREVDMVTPMCSQLTYEGLVDEFLRINNGSVELDASIMGAQQQDGKKMKVPLNSSDKLFKEIRDLNFEVVVQVLRQKATSMKQDYTEVTTMRHINLAQHLSTFTSKPSFLGQLDMEHTIIEAQSYDIPNDISYVFSGYAPLSIRLVQNAIRSGWRPMEEILKLLPGPHYETKRGGFSSSPSFDMSQGLSSSIDKVGDGRRSLVLVVFVGGVTFAEISALRFLSAQEGMAYDVIVGTTKIISGNSLAETFSENLG